MLYGPYEMLRNRGVFGGFPGFCSFDVKLRVWYIECKDWTWMIVLNEIYAMTHFLRHTQNVNR